MTTHLNYPLDPGTIFDSVPGPGRYSFTGTPEDGETVRHGFAQVEYTESAMHATILWDDGITHSVWQPKETP